MSQAQEVICREAIPEDAVAVYQFIAQVLAETDFITAGNLRHLSEAELALFLEQTAEKLNSICLIVTLGDQVIGLLNVFGQNDEELCHIGDVFVAVQKAYWGHGIGQLLMEIAIDWAEQSGVIRRLSLTVQARNEKAIHIYQKFGFVIEGKQTRGVRIGGEFLDTYAMARMIY